MLNNMVLQHITNIKWLIFGGNFPLYSFFNFYQYLPAGAREGRDRHRAPPPPEPHQHLQWGRAAEALEALMCVNVLTQQPLSSLWTHYFSFYIVQITVNSRLWLTCSQLHQALVDTITPKVSHSQLHVSFRTGWSVCTAEPDFPATLRICFV